MNHRHDTLLPGVVLLLTLFALLLFGSRQVSVTTDEMGHVAFGYAVLARGESAFWMLPLRGQPPLLNVMEAVLPYLANPGIPVERLAGWGVHLRAFVEDLAFQLFRVERAQMGWFRFTPALHSYPVTLPPYGIEQNEIVTRIPIMFLTVFLGALILRWCKELGGTKAGLLALFMLTFDPAILAHGRLASTDIGTVALGTIALYLAWRWVERPGWRWSLGTGLLLGLTMLAKASGVLWVAGFGLCVLGNALFGHKDGPYVRSLLLQGMVAGGISLFLVWACYGFATGYVPGIPVPLPAPAHWGELVFQTQGASEQQGFALGMRTQGSLWWYYPFAFLVKNPLPLLFGLAISLAMLDFRSLVSRRTFTLGVFPLLFTVIAVSWGRNISYRYILPIQPFLYLFIANKLSNRLGTKSHRWYWAVLGLSAWMIVEEMGAFPNEIAYFNQLVGGPGGGYRYLADSNVEWGQSSHVLYAYLQAHPETRDKPPKSRFLPMPGRYIVNASQLQGMNIGDPYAYEWFRHREPVGRVGDTLLLYDVPPRELAWFAQCDSPAIPLDEAAVAAGIGPMNWRQAEFDCRQAWLYPFGGAQSGIYALDHDLTRERGLSLPSLLRLPPAPVDSFIGRHLARASLSFEREISDAQSPAFLLYDMPAAAPAPPLTLAYPAAAETAPASLSNSRPVSAPLTLGPLVFLGAAAYRDGDSLDVETWWQATSEPITRPLSIMAHLLAAQGETLQVQDGLGVSPDALQTGDILVQRHRFSRPPQGTALWLRTGAYWLDTSKRWPIAKAPEADAIFIKLTQ
jgi:4-amino-4-deoxy-L-arabinose transferase-like glycosyltransferase